MADAELKPCPFCGGAVELERTTGSYEKMHGQREWWGVVCRNTINVGGTCAIQQVPSASKEAAVERWNRRSTSSVSEGEMPELPDETEPQWWFDLHAAAAALEDFGATGNAASVCKIANQLLAATKAAAPADAPAGAGAVGDFRRAKAGEDA